MTPLTFGRDIICPTCHGDGRMLGGKLECAVCRGTGLHLAAAPPPPLPEPGLTGAEHPDTSLEAEERLDRNLSRRAHVRILQLLKDGRRTDEQMSEILELEGCSSANGFRARRGELAAAGFIDTSPGEYGLTRAGRRAQLWFITATGLDALAAEEYRPPNASPKENR